MNQYTGPDLNTGAGMPTYTPSKLGEKTWSLVGGSVFTVAVTWRTDVEPGAKCHLFDIIAEYGWSDLSDYQHARSVQLLAMALRSRLAIGFPEIFGLQLYLYLHPERTLHHG